MIFFRACHSTDFGYPRLGRRSQRLPPLPRELRRVHPRFWCCARTGTAGRLSTAHRLYQPRYPRFREALDPARLGSCWQHRSGHQTPRGYLCGTKFRICSDHKVLESIGKVGDHNARVQQWLEFLTAFDYALEYRKGSDGISADSLSGLPKPATEHGRSRFSSLIPVDDGGIFLIRVCGFRTRSSLTPDVGLGGPVPRSENAVLSGLPFTFGFSRLLRARATYED